MEGGFSATSAHSPMTCLDAGGGVSCSWGCDVAVVTVEPSAEPPVRYRGCVWVRVGPSVREGSVEDERLLSERRRAADLPFDSRRAVGIELEDLNVEFPRDHYLPAAKAATPRRMRSAQRGYPRVVGGILHIRGFESTGLYAVSRKPDPYVSIASRVNWKKFFQIHTTIIYRDQR